MGLVVLDMELELDKDGVCVSVGETLPDNDPVCVDVVIKEGDVLCVNCVDTVVMGLVVCVCVSDVETLPDNDPICVDVTREDRDGLC